MAATLAASVPVRAEDAVAALVLEGVAGTFPLRQQRLRLEQSQNRRTSTWLALLPTLTVGGSRTYGTTESVVSDVLTPSQVQSGTLALSAGWTLWNNYQNIRDIQTSSLALQAERENSKGAVQTYIVNLLSSYFTLQLLKHQREVIEETLEHTRTTATESEELVKAGAKTPLDQLDTKVQVAKGERDLLEAKNAILSAERTLRALMGTEKAVEIPPFDLLKSQPYFMESFDREYKEIVSTWEERIGEANHRLKASSIRLEQSNASLWQTRFNYLPQTSVVLSRYYDMSGYVAPNTPEPNRVPLTSTTVALTFTWQAWDWLNTHRTISNAGKDQEIASLQFRDELTRTRADLRNRLEQYEVLMKSIEVSKLVADTSREQLNYSLELYKLGRINILNVQIANERFSQARIDYLTRVRDRYVLAAILLEETGRSLLPKDSSVPWL